MKEREKETEILGTREAERDIEGEEKEAKADNERRREERE